MGKLIDLTGKTFGRWTVLYRTDDYIEASGAKRAHYHCKCACGNEADVLAGSLRKGQSKSCGCLQREFAKSGAAKRTHGATGTRLHRIWKNMNTRCNNPKNQKYPRYGGRGISVCKEWSGKTGFEAFSKWAHENGYHEDLTIDRIDNDGDYTPENCRWVSLKMQENNTSKNRKITVRGITKTIAEWSEIIGIPRTTLYYYSDEGLTEILEKYF